MRRHWGEVCAKLADVIDAHYVGGIVLGWPRNIDGQEGRRCQATRAFAANLLAWRSLPLMFWDERLSSNAVAHALDETKLPPRKRLAVRDQLEATYILQGALDYMRSMDTLKT